MLAAHLSAEAWAVVAGIAGLTVLMCLATVAKILEYERGLQALIREVSEIRVKRGEIRDQPQQQSEPRAAA